MKKYLIALTALMTLSVNAEAMSYENAREQALFLTDKMAYELNLSPEQYDAAYEINLDYLMGVTTADEVYSEYWERRNRDLAYVLLSWQYSMFCDALYFYRPLYWDCGYWHFRIYARYPDRGWCYFDRPRCWATYRGEHCWRHHSGSGWYHGRTFVNVNVNVNVNNRGDRYVVNGMRDNWNGKTYNHAATSNRRGSSSGFTSDGNRSVGSTGNTGSSSSSSFGSSRSSSLSSTMRSSANSSTMRSNSGTTRGVSSFGNMSRSTGSSMRPSSMSSGRGMSTGSSSRSVSSSSRSMGSSSRSVVSSSSSSSSRSTGSFGSGGRR